jgi:hypothetical protein
MNNKNYILVAILLLFNCFYIFAQDQKKIEQLIKNSNVEMYENPDKVISTGLKIIQLVKDNIDLKIFITGANSDIKSLKYLLI